MPRGWNLFLACEVPRGWNLFLACEVPRGWNLFLAYRDAAWMELSSSLRGAACRSRLSWDCDLPARHFVTWTSDGEKVLCSTRVRWVMDPGNRT